MREKEIGRAVDKVGHGELKAQQHSVTMAAPAIAHRPLAWLELRQWRVSEVEEVMVEWCVRAITQWHGGGGVRARWSSAMVMAVLGLLLRVKERQREGERASKEERRVAAVLLPTLA